MPQTVLITGCSPGGIGHALAREFHRHHLRVFATARQTDTIADLHALGIETLALQVTDETSIAALVAEVSRRTNGTLDFLVNNAGRNYTVPALDVEIDEIRTTFETNVFGVMRLCQSFAPLLIAAAANAADGPGGGATIVQIGSVAGTMPYVFGSVYNASKAALHSYSDTLRVELAPFGVRVVTVVTGGVKSNIARVDRKLPTESVYAPIREEYETRVKHSQANGMPNEAYARSVVRQVLGDKRKVTIWEGGKSWLVWFMTTFFPKWVLVCLFFSYDGTQW